MKETTMNATPAHNKLPVKNQTTKAIIAPGSMNKSTFAIRMIIANPMTTRRTKIISSLSPDNPGTLIKGIKLTCEVLIFTLHLYLLQLYLSGNGI
jgi:Flp pilus assembly CpaF family ATPase